MSARTVAAAVILAANLAGCADYHQETAALRMPRPEGPPQDLASYAPSDNNYPSIGGDILKGTSPTETAAYQATTGAPVGPPADQQSAPSP